MFSGCILVLVVALAGSSLGLELSSHGWYRYYVLDELSGQPWVDTLWVGFWRDDLLAHFWPLAGLLAATLALGRWRPGQSRAGAAAGSDGRCAPPGYWALAVAGLLAAAWVSRLHSGGYVNVLIPAYAAVALAAGLACARLRRRGTGTGLLATALIIVQAVVLFQDPAAQLPTGADRRAGARLSALVRRLPAPVLVLRHPWYAQVLGRGAFAQGEGITDVLRSAAPQGRTVLSADLHGALDRDHVNAVVLDGGFDAALLGVGFARTFRLAVTIPAARRLYPLTDTRTAPALVYVRR